MKKNLTKACYVIASSFKDFECYPDNLIDDSPEKIWRALDAGYPQWIDFIFDNELKIDQIELTQVHGCVIKSVEVDYGVKEAKKRIKDVGINRREDTILIDFNVISTDRLRVWLDDVVEGEAKLQCVKIMGPEQIVHEENVPYWNAAHIWFPEPDLCYKGSSPRYFRKTIFIDDVRKFETAIIQARTNDSYEIFINGEFADKGAKIVKAVDVKQYLRNGKNVIAAKTDLVHSPGFWGLGVFIAELSLNREFSSVFYGTDSTWLSYNKKLDDWNSITFDDSAWSAAAEFSRPPEGIHGQINYCPPQIQEKASLLKNTPIDIQASSGGCLNLTVSLKPTKRIRGSYYFVMSIGEKERVKNWSEFIIHEHVFLPSVKTCDWVPNVEYPLDLCCEIPNDAPSGAYKLFLKGYEIKTGVELDMGLSEQDGYIANVSIDSEKNTLRNEPLDVKIVYENDRGYISINGEKHPPLFWRYGAFDSLKQFQEYSSTGINIHHLCIWPTVIKTGPEYWADDFSALDTRLRVLFQASPDAFVVLGIALIPDMKWMQENPNELAIDAFGNTGPISFCSMRFEKQVHEYMKRLILFVNEKSYGNRVIGYNPLSCGTPDSGLGGTSRNILQKNRDQINIGDYNPKAIAAFREFLKNKYDNSIEELRRKWRDDSVTFESAYPDIAKLVEEGANGAVFRDPSNGMMPFDYFEFLSHLLGGFYCRLAKMIKNETRGRSLVFVFYGYIQAQLRAFNVPGTRLQNNDFDLSILLENENIDCFITPPSYEYRNVGQPLIPRFPVDSARIHNKLYISEDDIRTFISHNKAWGRHKSENESEAIIKYYLSDHLIKGCGGWLFDQINSHEKRSGQPWFLEDKVLTYVRKCQQIYRDALSENVQSNTEIAVVLSAETPWMEDVYYAPPLYKNLVCKFLYDEMRKIGAPFDIVMMSDLKSNKFHANNYKLIVFLNAFYVSDEEKQNIERLKSNGRTLLFFYAPGYIDNESGLSVNGIGNVTGISVEEMEKRRMKCVTTGADTFILHGIDPGVLFEADAFEDADSKTLHPDVFGPVFHITDDATDIFLEYLTGQRAAGVRKFENWTSVYSAMPFLDSNIIRNIAKEAGAHIYNKDNILLNANNKFICVHNGNVSNQKITINLPLACNVQELFSEKVYADSAISFDLELEACKTYLFKLS